MASPNGLLTRLQRQMAYWGKGVSDAVRGGSALSPHKKGADAHFTLYNIRSQDDIRALATGCDADMGGRSEVHLDLDESGKGRFWGKLSSDVNPNAKAQRGGYAAFRNAQRAKLFGLDTWSMEFHPLLKLRVRNRLAGTASAAATVPQPKQVSPARKMRIPSSVLRTERLIEHDTEERQQVTDFQRATKALGHTLPEQPGPKYFVNLKSHGYISNDIYQHRLFFDPTKGDEWQDVVIPLIDFARVSSGEVAYRQMEIDATALYQVGIAVLLEPPSFPTDAPQVPEEYKAKRPLTKEERAQLPPGSMVQRPFAFDLGIESIEAVTEGAQMEALGISDSTTTSPISSSPP